MEKFWYHIVQMMFIFNGVKDQRQKQLIKEIVEKKTTTDSYSVNKGLSTCTLPVLPVKIILA